MVFALEEYHFTDDAMVLEGREHFKALRQGAVVVFQCMDEEGGGLYVLGIFERRLVPELFKVIKGAFAQRRKTLINSLSTVIGHIPKSALGEIITSCGFAEGVRGETLDIAAFAKIANAIDNYQA